MSQAHAVCASAQITTFPIDAQRLPTFVLDQHALQRGTGCDLAQPQFPVHLLSWYPKGKLKVFTILAVV